MMMSRSRWMIVVGIVIIMLGIGIRYTSMFQQTPLADVQTRIAQSLHRNREGVVSIIATRSLVRGSDEFDTQMKIGGASGIVSSRSGHILTNKHVVSDPKSTYSVVTVDGDVLPVTAIWLDPVFDLAVLNVDMNSRGAERLMPVVYI